MVRMAQTFSCACRWWTARQLRLAGRRPGRGHALHRGAPDALRQRAAGRARATARWASGPTTTAPTSSPWCCPRASRTSWSTARRASRWAWPPASRRTTWARSSACLAMIDDPRDHLIARAAQVHQGARLPHGGRAAGQRPSSRRSTRRPAAAIKLRGTWKHEAGTASAKPTVIIDSIPYGVEQAARAVEKIAEVIISQEAARAWWTCATSPPTTCRIELTSSSGRRRELVHGVSVQAHAAACR
jgi:hypothetical protein